MLRRLPGVAGRAGLAADRCALALLALVIAIAWKQRARGWVTPVLIAGAIAAKLFLWPLLIWLALVRGLRCSILAASATVALVAAPWVLGFPGARQYPELLSLLTRIESRNAYTPRAWALSLGASVHVAEAIAILAGGAVLGAALLIRRDERADQRTLALTLFAALLSRRSSGRTTWSCSCRPSPSSTGV